MRCWDRSTTWAGSPIAVLALAAGLAAGGAEAAVSDEAVRAAIVRAVEARVGAGARVEVRDLVVRFREDVTGSVFASLPTDARAGDPARVLLKVRREDGRAARFGEAECVIDVWLRGARATRPVQRGSEIREGDVEVTDVDAKALPFRPLPQDLEGARAVTDIAAGQVVQRSMVVPAPAVRTGDDVAVTVHRGPMVVEGRGIATQPGRLGDVIHVVNPESKKRIAARVTGRGAVEVLQ